MAMTGPGQWASSLRILWERCGHHDHVEKDKITDHVREGKGNSADLSKAVKKKKKKKSGPRWPQAGRGREMDHETNQVCGSAKTRSGHRRENVSYIWCACRHLLSHTFKRRYRRCFGCCCFFIVFFFFFLAFVFHSFFFSFFFFSFLSHFFLVQLLEVVVVVVGDL